MLSIAVKKVSHDTRAMHGTLFFIQKRHLGPLVVDDAIFVARLSCYRWPVLHIKVFRATSDKNGALAESSHGSKVPSIFIAARFFFHSDSPSTRTKTGKFDCVQTYRDAP